ncbi:MAG: glycosyl hydrolase [Bacteroidales bacterium]|nr:glycosyl hydrolase [Bacteroidales bacterium]
MNTNFLKVSAALIAITVSSITTHAYNEKYKDPTLPISERVEDLIGRMTLHEKVLQLQNNSTNSPDGMAEKYGAESPGSVHEMEHDIMHTAQVFYNMQKYLRDSTRLGIPALTSVEGIHGILQNGCTIFPQAIAQGATFNPQLIERMTAAEAQEAKAMGIYQLLSPVLDIPRELRWGRVEETFGEDPYLIATMASAFVNGAQKNGVGCMPKHFVAHGSPVGGLNCAHVSGGERELRNLYAYPFAKVIKNTHPVSIMSCYSAYDGVPVTGSSYFMTDLLRGELGFDGFVYSDWGSVDRLKVFHSSVNSSEAAARQALMAGIDMDVWDWAYSTLEEQVERGELDEEYIDRACRRILEAKFRLGLFDNPIHNPEKANGYIRTSEHIALAKEIADESIVLLENNGILPLDATKYRRIALLGPNSDYGVCGDYGWVDADHREAVTLTDALRKKLEGISDISQLDGCDWWSLNDNSIAEAAAIAEKSDLAIVAVGTRSLWLGRNAKAHKVTSGEGFDLSSLELPGQQLDLLKTVKATGKPMIVVLITGKPLVMDWAKENADALLLQFYGGEQQGNALADVILGEVNPSGKVNVSFPRSTGNTPCFYNYYPGDREQVFDKGGSAAEPNGHYVFDIPYALYPFGYGQSYTTFTIDNAEIIGSNSADTPIYSPTDTIQVSVSVTNRGDRPGKEVVQLYARDMVSSINTPVRQLKDFSKISLEPGETKHIVMNLPIDELAIYTTPTNRVVEPGDFEIYVGSSSADTPHTIPFKVQ